MRKEGLAAHKEAFPFNDNLFAMLFLIQSDLDDRQRLALIQQFRMQKISMGNWTYDLIRTEFMELFHNPRSNFDDPNVKPVHSHSGNRTFLVLDEFCQEEQDSPAVGILDDCWQGYWVEDEATGIEGFLDANEDDEGYSTFWILEEGGSIFQARRFKGRRFKKGGKRRKGKVMIVLTENY